MMIIVPASVLKAFIASKTICYGRRTPQGGIKPDYYAVSRTNPVPKGVSATEAYRHRPSSEQQT